MILLFLLFIINIYYIIYMSSLTGLSKLQSNDLRLNPITTAASNTNKLLTRNQGDGAVEETNISVNRVLLSDIPKPLFSRWANNITVANATFTNVPFGSTLVSGGNYDATNAFISLEADNTTFKNNTSQTHQYLVSYNIYFEVNGTGQRRAQIRINNGDSVAISNVPAVAGDYTMLNGSAIVVLAPNEVFTIRCFQNSGTAVNMVGTTGNSCIQILALG
jgi:hypothetical protein